MARVKRGRFLGLAGIFNLLKDQYSAPRIAIREQLGDPGSGDMPERGWIIFIDERPADRFPQIGGHFRQVLPRSLAMFHLPDPLIGNHLSLEHICLRLIGIHFCL
jgi:hypothetical protein